MTTTGPETTNGKSAHAPEPDPRNAVGAMKAIYQRRAVRAYTDEPVSREDIELLIDAAIHAPSAVNCQPWAFVVLQDRGTLARFASDGKALLLNEPPELEVVESGLPDIDRLRQMASGADFELFHDARAVIVIYATGADGVPDCFLCAENLMLAAWSLGLGTCPIGFARPLFNRALVKDELMVPHEWLCALPIALGWPGGETPPTSRRPAHIVSWR